MFNQATDVSTFKRLCLVSQPLRLKELNDKRLAHKHALDDLFLHKVLYNISLRHL
jgi:oligoribonuclease (3'-5' exoribonuclease)